MKELLAGLQYVLRHQLNRTEIEMLLQLDPKNGKNIQTLAIDLKTSVPSTQQTLSRLKLKGLMGPGELVKGSKYYTLKLKK